MIVQIYEIQTPEEAEKCIALGVDHIGSVILSEEAWLQPLLREVVQLSRGTSVANSLIPLFRDVELIYRAMDYYQPHYVHFCEDLSSFPARKRNLASLVHFQMGFKARYPQIGIIRSIPLPPQGTPGDVAATEIASVLEPVSDMFLIDTWLPNQPVKGFVGITGKTVDWRKAGELCRSTRIPVLLAGGLSPENVCEAILKVRPRGADSCTLTNATDIHGKPVRFKKDFLRVKAFVKEVRRAEVIIDNRHVCGAEREKAIG